MTYTIELTEVTDDLLTFIQCCNDLGYKNNNTLTAMKFYHCLDEGGTWYVTYHENKIVGVSGVHPFLDGVRALFRGAQLYSIPGGLTKTHMNCWMFKYHLPLVIKRHLNTPIFITTNTNNDASGKMLRLNKLYHILEKKNIVKCEGEYLINGVYQNLWELNKEVYFKVRGKE